MGGVGTAGRTAVARRPQAELAQVVELILDKGLVIDVDARVSLVGLELISIRARIVVASVDTYLRYAEAVSRTERSGLGTSSGNGPRKRDIAAGVLDGGREWLGELREERRARRKGTR